MAMLPELGPLLEGANVARAARGFVLPGFTKRLVVSLRPPKILRLFRERKRRLAL